MVYATIEGINRYNEVQPVVLTASGLRDCNTLATSSEIRRELTNFFNRHRCLVNEIGYFIQISKIRSALFLLLQCECVEFYTKGPLSLLCPTNHRFKESYQPLGQPRRFRPVQHTIAQVTPGFHSPARACPPCHNEFSKSNINDQQEWQTRKQTSILSMSIFPYCFFISLFATCMASRVAIVFRRLSVVIAADSMLNVCCASCAN